MGFVCGVIWIGFVSRSLESKLSEWVEIGGLLLGQGETPLAAVLGLGKNPLVGLLGLGETLVVMRMMTYNLLSWSSVFHGDSLSQALAVQYQSSVWHTHV